MKLLNRETFDDGGWYRSIITHRLEQADEMIRAYKKFNAINKRGFDFVVTVRRVYEYVVFCRPLSKESEEEK